VEGSFVSAFGTIACNANHINASLQLLPEAEAKRRL
jgi:hypothetical protein